MTLYIFGARKFLTVAEGVLSIKKKILRPFLELFLSCRLYNKRSKSFISSEEVKKL